jgi:hypothetical protein
MSGEEEIAEGVDARDGCAGGSSKRKLLSTQKDTQVPAMIHPDEVKPLNIAFLNPILCRTPPRKGPADKPNTCPTTRSEARVVRLRIPTRRGSEQYLLWYMKHMNEMPVTIRPMSII